MNSILVSAGALAAMVACGALGFFIRTRLRDEHLSDDSIRAISLSTGVLATMSGMILGMMLSSAQSSFSAVAGDINSLATKVVLLDNALRKYGPDADPLRSELRRDMHLAYDRLQDPSSARQYVIASSESQNPLEHFMHGMKMLVPNNDLQKSLQDRMLSLVSEIEAIQWNLVHGSGSSLPTPFIAAMVFWFAAVFLGFGAVTANNAMVFVTLFLCALSVSVAIFLGMEMSSPFTGLMNVSLHPVQDALAQIDRQ
jgi:hypothetical protein